MLMLVAAIAAAAAEPAAPRAVAQARASIRILSAVRLRVGAEQSDDGRPVRSSMIREIDGSRVPAKLVEFE